jgi:hypothetical protein
MTAMRTTEPQIINPHMNVTLNVYGRVSRCHNKVIYIINQYYTVEYLFPATCFGLIGPSSGSDTRMSRVIELPI